MTRPPVVLRRVLDVAYRPTRRQLAAGCVMVAAQAAICCVFWAVPALRDVLIAALSAVARKPLNAPAWHTKISRMAEDVCVVAVIAGAAWYAYGRGMFRSAGAGRAACAGAFAVWLVLTFITVLRHEPWRDEYHAWLIARTYSVPQVFHEMRYEGHFALWFLLLMPLAKLGAPLLVLNLISWVVTGAAMAFFLRKAPFTLPARMAVLFSTAFLFWYPVVSRPYVLIPPLLFLLADVYEARGRHPLAVGILLALLANTHAYIEGFVGIVSLLFLVQDVVRPWRTYTGRQRAAHIASLGIIGAGVLGAFLQVAPAFSMQGGSSIVRRGLHVNIRAAGGFLSGSQIFIMFWPLFALLFCIFLVWLFRRDRGRFAILCCSCLYMGVFAVCLYGAGVANRALLWFPILIFSLWGTRASREVRSLVLIVLSLFIIRPSINLDDWRQDFAPEGAVAAYIQSHYPAGTPVFIQTGHHTATFAMKLPDAYPAYHLESGAPVRLYSFRTDYNPHEERSVPEYLASLFADGRTCVLLVSVSNDRGTAAAAAESIGSSYPCTAIEFPGLAGGSLWLLEVRDVSAP